MIMHDLVIMGLEVIKKYSTNKVDIAIIDDAIELIKRGGAVERDVKRFIELLMKDNQTGQDTFDIEILKNKLMKVGNEDE